ncbi:hypothetical protein [uncultured Fibrobacter sp.]|uniref:hypothetical protein n=1 Tax=uncultured Fibrobacter sp. TaxID=261512 RepID=UPI0025D70E1A|nr:hypothetical protein [uncultured Fibrobacter sp.]
MKIEKRKVTEAKPLSVAAKSAITAALGLTVASTFIACGGDSVPNDFQDPESSDDSTLTSSDTAPTSTSEDSQPSSSNATASDEATPKSSSATEPLQSSSEQVEAQQSSSEQTETSQSGSSQVVVDIPLSHEPISSSVLEALSSAAESSSSATTPTSSSSSDVKFGDTPNNDTICPPPFPSSDPCKCVPDGTTVEYQTEFGVLLITCPLPASSQSSGFSFSMVTTFEKTDIEV